MLKRLLVGAVVLLAAAKPALAAYGGPGVSQGGTTSGQTGDLLFCAVVSSSSGYTAGTTQPCNLTLSGALKVDGSGVTQPTSIADGSLATLGAKADAAAGTGSVSLMAVAKQLHLDMVAPTPAGTNNIGSVTNIPSTGATITTSQSSVTTTAAALSFSGTVHREIENMGTANIYIGASGVTTSTGFPIPPGTSYDASRFTGTLYAIAASAQTAALISY